MLHTSRLHLNAVSRFRWSLIISILDDCRMIEVLMQMIDILLNAQLPTDTNIINSTQMLSVFRQPNTTTVGYDRDIEFLGHE